MPLHSCAEPKWFKYGKRAATQFVTAVLVWCGKRVEFDSVSQPFVKLNLGSTYGALSESDVAPVLLQSWPYLIRFSTWKVRCLNQALGNQKEETD